MPAASTAWPNRSRPVNDQQLRLEQFLPGRRRMQRELRHRPAPPLSLLGPEFADDDDRALEVLRLLERNIEARRTVAFKEVEAFDRLVVRDHAGVGIGAQPGTGLPGSGR